MTTFAYVLAIGLVVLTPIPWLAVALLGAALHADPEVDELRRQRERFAIAGVAGLCVTVLSAAFLARRFGFAPLPMLAAFILLTVAILSIYAQPALFLITHWRYTMDWLARVFQTEPVVVIGTVTAAVDGVVLLAVAFGAPVTTDQKMAIDVAVTAVLGGVAMIFVRSQVTPVAVLKAPVPAPAPTPASQPK